MGKQRGIPVCGRALTSLRQPLAGPCPWMVRVLEFVFDSAEAKIIQFNFEREKYVMIFVVVVVEIIMIKIDKVVRL